MEPQTKQVTIAVDFDGVIHAYTSPWTSPVDIHDAPIDGAFAFLRDRLANGWRVVLHTCRLMNRVDPAQTVVPEIALPPRVHAIMDWFAAHGGDDITGHQSFYMFTGGGKPHADVYLDDRAIRFEGVFPDAATMDNARTPWNKR